MINDKGDRSEEVEGEDDDLGEEEESKELKIEEEMKVGEGSYKD